MARNLLSPILVTVIASSVLAVDLPVMIYVDDPVGNPTSLLIHPDRPARLFEEGDEQTTELDLVIEVREDGYWYCESPLGLLGGVTHLDVVHDQVGCVFAEGPYPLSVPTDPQGAGVFDLATVRGGGFTVTEGYLQLVHPETGDCPTSGRFLCRVASADIDGNFAVNLTDLTFVAIDYGSNAVRSDFNDDGIVNLSDFSLFADAYFPEE